MAVAYGSAAAALPGSALPTPAQIDLNAVRVTPIAPISTHHQHESIAMTSTASQPIINTDLVLLDVDAGGDKQAVIGRLVSRLADAGRTTDTDGLIAAAMAREEQSATGLPGGIAIPHCRSPYVDTASIGFARLNPAVDFGAPDGPADLAFLIAAPEAGGAEHMKLLSSLARALVRKDFVESLRNASTPAEVVELVDGVVNPTGRTSPQPAAEPAKATAQDAGRDHRVPDRHRAHLHGRRLAGRRRQEGRRRRCTSRRRAHRAARRWRASTIAAADAVIFATDVGVKDKGRFAGKPVVASGVKRAINEPDKMVAEALAAADNPERRPRRGRASAPPPRAPHSAGGVGWGTRTRQILLTGVSYMIPFVAAGGLLIALGFLFAGYEIANTPDGEKPRCLRIQLARQHHRHHQLADQPALRRFDAVPRRGAVQHSAGWRSCSWFRRWPATSRSPSPTGPASRRASPRARSPSSSAAASSAASSAA